MGEICVLSWKVCSTTLPNLEGKKQLSSVDSEGGEKIAPSHYYTTSIDHQQVGHQESGFIIPPYLRRGELHRMAVETTLGIIPTPIVRFYLRSELLADTESRG
jgi:hypothetical protein